MDDKDKSIFESVTDTIKNTFDIATEAAKKALEPERLKPDEEVVVITAPASADPMSPMPPMLAVVKKKPHKKSVDTSGRTTPTYDIPVPQTPLSTPKKAAKKASRKPAKKIAQKVVVKSKTKKAVEATAAKRSKKKTTKESKANSAVRKTKKVAKKTEAKKSAKKTTKKKSKR